MRNSEHQTKITKRRNHILLRNVSGGGYADTGVSRRDVAAADAQDAITEALAEREDRKGDK